MLRIFEKVSKNTSQATQIPSQEAEDVDTELGGWQPKIWKYFYLGQHEDVLLKML